MCDKMKEELKEAVLYEKLENRNVKCNLCNRRCTIGIGRKGFCGVRENRDGTLYSLVYGKAVAWNIDSIEKKPFYHFFPGTNAFSIATVGCNFRCMWCQNWEISQPTEIFGQDLPPETIVKMTVDGKAQGIAYTYTEPTVFFEYAHDTAILGRKKGLYNVFVTNGYMTPETINKMDFLDASRIDLKAFDEKTYMKYIGGAHLEHVLNSIKLLHKKQHIEIINLVIPTINDSDDEIGALSEWVRDLDKEIPLHFTAYYPAHKFTIPPTPIETLERAQKIAKEVGLNYVYTGNIPGHPGENTYCPNCGEPLIQRLGFFTVKNLIKDEKSPKCPSCGHKIKIVTKLDWMK